MSLDPTASKDAAVGLLRQAYRAAGDDPEIGALYSLALVRTSPLAGHDDEGLAVLDRLYERYPRQSLRNLSWAIVAGDHDLDREGRLVDRMGAVLPEMRGRSDTVHFLVWSKRFDEARAAVDFARQLGRGTQASASMLWSKAEIELSAFRPLEARAPAFSVFADPNQDVSEYGARLYIASYFMSGQVIAGRSKLLEEVQRQSQFGNKWRMAGVRLMDLGHGRFLGDEVPGAAILEEVEQARTESASTRAYEAATARCEVALARMRAEPTGALKVGTSRLVELEHWAEEISGGDKIKRDGLLTSTLALTRAVRGVGAAARRWRETERAPFAVRRQMAFDAALALEATGDARGAIDAYRLAQDPYDIEWYGFVAAASEVRLAQLYRAQGRAREAEESEALVARVWVNADAGLVEAIRRLK
jgi:tetratricopeptide (TPR) repeat protein